MALDPLLDQLTRAVTHHRDLEGLARALLPLLCDNTELDGAYLARLDPELQQRRILYAHVEKSCAITEQQLDPRPDTAMVPPQPCSQDRFPDGQLITWRVEGTTYIDAPIQYASGEIFGTLCGICSGEIRNPEVTRQLLSLCAFLIARQIDHEQLVGRLRRAGLDHHRQALSDPLTGVSNRRALLNELARMLANAERCGGAVHVACIDVDEFKSIHERYGSGVADQFLVHIARSLTCGMRQGDLVARVAIDRFVVVAGGGNKAHADNREVLRRRLESLLAGHFHAAAAESPLDGASVGIVTSQAGERNAEQLVARAERAMHEIKRFRQVQPAVAGSHYAGAAATLPTGSPSGL